MFSKPVLSDILLPELLIYFQGTFISFLSAPRRTIAFITGYGLLAEIMQSLHFPIICPVESNTGFSMISLINCKLPLSLKFYFKIPVITTISSKKHFSLAVMLASNPSSSNFLRVFSLSDREDCTS